MNARKRQARISFPVFPALVGAILLGMLVLLTFRVGNQAVAQTTSAHSELASLDARTQVAPGERLASGEASSPSPWVFDHLSLNPFAIQAQVFHSIAPPATPAVTIEAPADAQGWSFVGVGQGTLITVKAPGSDPVTVELFERPSLGSGLPFAIRFRL